MIDRDKIIISKTWLEGEREKLLSITDMPGVTDWAAYRACGAASLLTYIIEGHTPIKDPDPLVITMSDYYLKHYQCTYNNCIHKLPPICKP